MTMRNVIRNVKFKLISTGLLLFSRTFYNSQSIFYAEQAADLKVLDENNHKFVRFAVA